jgi:hypothetical protein
MRKLLGALVAALALMVALLASAAPASAGGGSYTGGHFVLDLDGH